MKNKIFNKFTLLLLIVALLPMTNIFAQSKIVSGKTLDANGNPIAGVEIRIKGAKNIEATSDAEGFYSIEVGDKTCDVLIFDKENYDEKELDIRNQDNINVKMYSSVRYNAYGREVKRLPVNAEFRDGFLTIESTDQKFKFWFDNRVYFDMAYFPTEDVYNPIGNGVNIRRARFAVKARVWKHWGGEIDVDFAGAVMEMKDMYIQYYFMNGNKDWGHLKAGNFKEGFSMETTTTSRYVSFIERSLMSKLTPSRHLGIAYTQWGKKWLFIGGIHFQKQGEAEEVAFSQDANKKAGIDEGYSLTARGVFTPINDEEKVLHIGGAYSYRTPLTSAEVYKGIRYSTRSMSSINRKKYLDTDDVTNVDVTTLYNVELAGAYKNFIFQAEYTGSKLKGTNLNNNEGIDEANYDGAYAQIGWLIFGGKYNYNMREGEFTQVSRGKEWGDLELLFRFDYLNLNDFDAKIYGGSANAYTLGLNFHVNTNVKLMLNYSYLNHDRYANGKGKLYVGYDAQGELTKDPNKVAASSGEGGEDFGMIQARIEIDF
ncbi:MAG: porin [Bacteroidetes bacterium 4572_77]|nr:MAG: porin [Bacteroidetes bacterium 4572_77]